MTTYYNRHKFHAVLLTHDAQLGRVLQRVSCLGDWLGEALTFGAKLAVPDGDLRLAVSANGAVQQFFWATLTGEFAAFDEALDAAIISDEGGRGEHSSFTGAFVGMIAHDLTGQGWSALVRDFSYQPM